MDRNATQKKGKESMKLRLARREQCKKTRLKNRISLLYT